MEPVTDLNVEHNGTLTSMASDHEDLVKRQAGRITKIPGKMAVSHFFFPVYAMSIPISRSHQKMGPIEALRTGVTFWGVPKYASAGSRFSRRSLIVGFNFLEMWDGNNLGRGSSNIFSQSRKYAEEQ